MLKHEIDENFLELTTREKIEGIAVVALTGLLVSLFITFMFVL